MKETETQAVPVSSTDLSPSHYPRGRDLLNGSKHGFVRLLHPRNIVGLLWLAPALALIILNYKGHIVGSGLNCGGHCKINPNSTSQVSQIERLDKTNRDVLGALQFVAKGLEVWFMYVAASLIYRVALYLSAKDNRLPVSLLLVYAEFMDLLYLKDLAMKARDLAVETGRNASVPATKGRVPTLWILYSFIALVMVMCAVANLMGVATATLVIPGLQWIDINKAESTAFGQLLASEPPTDDRIAACKPGSLADGLYNCTANMYASSLDELVEAAIATERQFQGREGVLLPPVSQEQQLSFSANVSEPFRWVASRQLLRDFSKDLVNYHVATSSNVPYGDRDTYPDSHRFNQSLQVQLQRVGPTIGLAGTCWFYRAPSVIEVSDNRQVRCYAGLGETNFTKCIRWGSGWEDNPSSSSASFIIQAPTSSRLDLGVSIYTTASARYLHPDSSSCVANGSCDWDALFSDPGESTYRNISASQQTYEYTMPGYTNDSAIWCDNTAFLSFAAYALSPSPVTNLLQLVQLGILHDEPGSVDNNAATISLHPDWTLAAWSANRRDGIVPGTRGSASRFIEAFQRFTFQPEEQALQFRLIHQNALMQAVSLIPYTTTLLTPSNRSTQRAQEEANPYTSATLTSWATVQLWKYGIDSRTKVLGVVVLIMGMVVVLLTTILWFEAPKSPTQIVVGALLHPPPPGAIKDEETGAPLTVRLMYPGLEGKETAPATATATAMTPTADADTHAQDPASRPKRHRRTSSFGFSHPASPVSPGVLVSPLSSPGVGTGTAGGTGTGAATPSAGGA
ncbi:uncharacterized protein DSM5745_06151 [Aspergillus mulundensis]|uniref:Uncharacterized protein n=1 Tax=Aspergillus mulundensis TaxID=1810919 RepID=A0A3D8RZ20_9EURO|nr:Uncharacterized protein DSM5745_06151 [Aspergillus mulundensis]RDW79299.1 Uncharacterized protein DSM5745_06151 [Aspergillus mulundensis]